MGAWMDGTNEWMHGWINGWMDKWMDRQWVHGWMGQMNGWLLMNK